ncbi:MAG TPA: hypothetical protein VF765_35320 [Polyangiaceae bacterium]
MRPSAPLTALLALVAGCAGAREAVAPTAPAAALRETGLAGAADAMVHGARLVPLRFAEARSWGTEPGGGLRAIVAGERVVTWGDGSIVASADRLPGAASNVVAVPERMGGGFLFAIGAHLWRSDAWLGAAQPVFTSPTAISSVQVGLDRVYVRTQTGAISAIDPRQGAAMELGPLPASPNVGRLAALDAWRAVAVADLRGAMLTLDAGATWRALPLPIQASDVLALGDLLAVGGMNAAHEVEWWEVRADGQTARLASAPAAASSPDHGASAPDVAMRILGARPLAAAVGEGWPLSDGTALVARDGALMRVSLSDGSVAEAVPGAFALQPSRCEPLALPREGDPGGFGFLCGEPRGRTLVLRWSPAAGRLEELHRFDHPREVLASGLGALAVRGPCAPEASPDVPAPEVAWCLMNRAGAWSEMRFRGEDVDRARLVALHDGHVALVRPPRAGDLSTARLTVTDGTRSTHVALAFPELRAEIGRLLRTGTWLDGFEERRPGVLGGWVEGAGTLVGVEITLDGGVRVGEYVRDAGSPFSAGRFAFGWTASRRGFESTDGGMTWTKDLELPEPIAQPRDVAERACGPVGCLVAGWMRIGWGPAAATTAPREPPPRPRPPRDMAPLDLACELEAPDPPPPPAKGAREPAHTGLRSTAPLTLVRPWSMSGVPILPTCAQELPRFQGHAPPALGADECGLQVVAEQGLEWPLRHMDLAQLYAWGPRSGDWDGTGKWRVSWLWPWGGWTDGRSSAPAPTPWGSRELAAHALGIGQGPGAQWALLPGDDPDHALLVLRHTLGSSGSQVLALDADRPPTDVRRPTGDPFADVEGAARVAGRWYLATSQSAGELAATVVWAVDGGSAREIARLPRAGGETLTALRLGRRVDGRAVGVVVDGQPAIEGGTPARWVVGIDLESGAVSDPERLAALVPGDAGASPVCGADDGGWQIDLPSPANVRVHAAGSVATLQGTLLRLRLSHDHACIERVSGSLGSEAATVGATSRGARAPLEGRTLEAAIYANRLRRGFRCVVTR